MYDNKVEIKFYIFKAFSASIVMRIVIEIKNIKYRFELIFNVLLVVFLAFFSVVDIIFKWQQKSLFVDKKDLMLIEKIF